MTKLMIIDDDASIRQGLSLRLRSAGFEVFCSDHPETAIADVLRKRPDAILLDIEMPGFNGLDFHDCLKYTERGRDIPIIYLSGCGTPPNLEDAFRQGAHAFIAKPYEPELLVATIRGVIQRRRALDTVAGAPVGGPAQATTKSAVAQA
jgi:DNA-binding response OmpR family regulator